jgi:hypothetical protein
MDGKDEEHKRIMNLLRLLVIGTFVIGGLAITSIVLAIVYTLRGPH